MSQKIAFRRGTDAARQSVVLDVGEPAFTTDSHDFYIGDGTTLGGVLVGGNTLTSYNESFIAIIPESGSTPQQNASAYYTALQNGYTKTPYGKPLSEKNRYSVLLFPGEYEFSQLAGGSVLINDHKYVDTIGVGDRREICLVTPGNLSIRSGDCVFSNLTMLGTGTLGGILTMDTPIKNVIINNCFLSGYVNTLTYITNDSHISGMIVKDSVLFGNPLSRNFNDITAFVKNSSFDNVIFNLTKEVIFHGSQYEPHSNNLFNDCSFIFGGDSEGFYHDSINLNSLDSTNLFQNCYFSGAGVNGGLFFDGDQGATTPFQARMDGCTFDGQIASFYGTMNNCIIDGRRIPSSAANRIPINLNNAVGTIYPAFYNCTILSSGTTTSVTGLVGASGLFSHCRFNNMVASGVTGRFGNQFNTVHRSMKY